MAGIPADYTTVLKRSQPQRIAKRSVDTFKKVLPVPSLVATAGLIHGLSDINLRLSLGSRLGHDRHKGMCIYDMHNGHACRIFIRDMHIVFV